MLNGQAKAQKLSPSFAERSAMDNHSVRSCDYQSIQYNSHASRFSMDSCCDHG
jgi:hypothetical protein